MIKSIFLGTLVILPSIMPLACVKPGNSSQISSTGTKFTGTAYSCTGVSAYPADNLFIAVTEGSKLFSDNGIKFFCVDNFQDLDFNNPPWGQKDNNHFLSKVPDLIGFIKQFPESFRYQNGRWQVNTPNCTDAMKSNQICGKSVVVRAESYLKDGQNRSLNTQSDAVIYDACPRNHWNNAIKNSPIHPDHLGIGNPCDFDKQNHVDLNEALWNKLGFPKDVDSVNLTVTMKGQQGSYTPNPTTNQATPPAAIVQAKPANGMCPDGSNGLGKGFGVIYQCGNDTCAKSDKDGYNPCIISKGSQANQGGQAQNGMCPDGSNGSGKGYGIIYTCGDKKCAKSDKDGYYPCVIGY
ncbi:MAG: hypothetical protein NTX25_05585 [Proteobacteria bacterium]|nr:hypothetical protein [Pseudomonadota bacterium]